MSGHYAAEELVLWAEGEHPAAGEVAAHLGVCPDCAAAAESQRRLLEALRRRAADFAAAPAVQAVLAAGRPARILSWRRPAPLAAAAAAAAIVAAVFLFRPEPPNAARVEFGSAGLAAGRELKEGEALPPLAAAAGLRFGDGTLACLDRGSSGRLRRGGLELAAGRVHVNSPGGRGFFVQTPAGRVTDLGTVFVVEQGPAGARAAVIRGRVRLAPEGGAAFELEAGQAAAVAPGAAPGAAAGAAETAWVWAVVFPARLEDEPLEKVFALVEGIGPWRIEAPGELRQLRVTGVIAGVTPEGVLAAAAAAAGMELRLEGERAIFAPQP